jgi:hypothetical protein
MKPLILILLAATYAAAQNPTIADIARQERARRAQNPTTKVYTTKDVTPASPAVVDPEATVAPGTTIPVAVPTANPAAPGLAGPAGPAAAQPLAPAAVAPEVPGGVDPVQKWLEDTEKMRANLRQMVDQETAAQLEINAITNRVYAPVTSVPERNRAQSELGLAQTRLQTLRDQIAKARAELAARELEGPPKK